MITSRSNARVRQAADLAKKSRYRNETGLYLVEGPKMVGELPQDQIECVYATEKFLETHGPDFSALPHLQTVSEEVLKAMCDTQTPQGILAVARQCRFGLSDILSAGKPALLMILEAVQDPGNLGTILRAGEGAGVTGVIMDEKTADIYAPKTVRSTMGALFRVPFLRTGDLAAALEKIRQSGVRLAAAHLEGSTEYDEADYTGPVAFLIGNEAAGLSSRITELADIRVRIPMEGRVESLNAAVAASLLMYEAARQRRKSR